MKTKTFIVYSDPAHAWVKVEKSLLERIIGSNWRSIFTPFSYEKGDWVYLEEDCDTARFLNWCKASDLKPILKEAPQSKTLSRIRRYPHLSPI